MKKEVYEKIKDDEDWSNLENRDELMRKIEKFIIKHTK